MKRLGAAAAEAVVLPRRDRHKAWLWCRLKNGFFDEALWRVVAQMTGLPLFQVQAFAGRLECLANMSEPRGFVGEFRPAEFGAATGMPADQAALIYAALEHPEIGWIDQGYVASFFARNPDKEDVTAPERDRRRKARGWIRKELKKRAERGWISAEQRDGVLAILELIADEELFGLKSRLQDGVALEAALSTGHAGHGVATRGSVVATPRAQRIISEQPLVDNSGAGAREAEKRPSEEGVAGTDGDPQNAARLWMDIAGRRIAIRRMPDEEPGRVDLLLSRWCEQDCDGDAVAVMTAIIECDRLNRVGASFHVEMTQACTRYRRQKLARADLQAKLPLAGMQPVDKRRA